MRPVPLLLPILALLGAPVAAQETPPSVNDFKLPPPPQPRIDPRLQGPALRPAPVPLPSERPSAAPPPRPSASEQTAPTPTPSSEAQGAPRRTTSPASALRSPSRETSSQIVRGQVRPNPTGESAPSTTEPTASAPAPLAPNSDATAGAPIEPTAAPTGSSEPLPDGERSIWPLVLLGLAAMMALGAMTVAVLRRRRTDRRPARPRQPVAAMPAKPTPPTPNPTLTRGAKPVAAPPLTDDRADETVAAGPLRLLFEPLEAHATPFGTTLKARITVTNTGSVPLTDLTLRLAIAGAGPEGDAKLAAMLAGGGEGTAEPLGDVAPGESRAIDRSLRVGAREFRPIQLADRTIFVPQVAFELAGQAAGEPVRLGGACLVGRRPAQAGGKMGPFRLDLGPRHYRDLMQRPHDPGSAAALARAS